MGRPYTPNREPPMPLFPEVNGTPVTWDDPLSVPSGADTHITPGTWALTVTDASPAVGESWSVVVNGTTVTHVVTDTDPGAPVVPQTQDEIAAALELLIEAIPGVSSAAVANVVTVTPVVPNVFVPVSSPATTGGGAFTAVYSGTAKDYDPQPTP